MFLESLALDSARLRSVAERDLTAAVPSCPGWTVADLVRHVGQVYLHKATTMRLGTFPDPWPPGELAAEEPLALFDRGFAELMSEFAAREPSEAVRTWHEPNQTVGFWIRRMAHESVIHRLDAELALGVPVAPIPADLAADGVDEVLKLFVAYGSRAWEQDLTEVLSTAVDRVVEVRLTEGRAWRVRTTTAGAEVVDVEGASGDVAVGGEARVEPEVFDAGGASGDVAAGGEARVEPEAFDVGGESGDVAVGGEARVEPEVVGVPVGAVDPVAGVAGADDRVGGAAGRADVDAVVTGDAVGMLRWLWSRESPGQTAVRQEGSGRALTELRSLLTAATQ